MTLFFAAIRFQGTVENKTHVTKWAKQKLTDTAKNEGHPGVDAREGGSRSAKRREGIAVSKTYNGDAGPVGNG